MYNNTVAKRATRCQLSQSVLQQASVWHSGNGVFCDGLMSFWHSCAAECCAATFWHSCEAREASVDARRVLTVTGVVGRESDGVVAIDGVKALCHVQFRGHGNVFQLACPR